MLEFFYTDKYDNEIVFKNDNESISKKEFKQYISSNLPLLKQKKKNVVLIPDNLLTFAVNFFTSAFAGKNIYLVDDVKKINKINADFDILNSFVREKSEIYDFPEINTDSIEVNFFTSGSSGEGKCIKKTLSALIKEGSYINETLQIHDTSLTVATSTSCGHLYGIIFGFIFPLANHLPIWADTIEYPDLYNVSNSIFVSTPAFLDTVRRNNITLKQAKYITSSGSKLKKETFEYLENFANVIEIYGSTETGAIACKRNSQKEHLTLMKDVTIEPLENSSVISLPYNNYKPIEINDKIEVFGNEILLKNRTDRLLKIQEKRISAEGLENYLNKNSLVSESYCFESQDKIACLCALSDEGKEFILNKGNTELTKTLKKYLTKEYEIVPQRWKFIDEIPKTKVGKIDKYFIEHLFEINISLPVILKREIGENMVSLDMYLYKNCDFYSGHFPNFPITPGVVQLYFASFLGEYFFNEKLTGGQIKRIKFNNIINAGEVVKIKLEKKSSSVSFEYLNNDKVFSSGVFSCENIFEGVS